MKTIERILIVLILLVTPMMAACQIIRVDVTLPSFAGLIGLGPHTEAFVFNPTPFTGKVFAMNKYVGVLKPGASMYDYYHLRFPQSVLPLVIQWYRDSTFTDWIGTSAHILRLYAPTDGQNVVASWIIDRIDFPDGRYQCFGYYGVSPYPAPKNSGSERVNFPDVGCKSTDYIQIPSCTYYTLQVLVNGMWRGNLERGGFYYLKAPTAFYSFNAHIVLKVLDGDRFVGYINLPDVSFWRDGLPDAYQYIATPDQIRRYP